MWIVPLFVCCLVAASSTLAQTQVRVCVSESNAESCQQMASDLPESFSCVTAPDALGCMRKVQRGEADVTNVEPRAIFLGGRHLGLVPITTELFEGVPYRYQGIALVRKNSDIQSPSQLRGRPSCHTGVGRTVGWNIPLGRLMAAGIITFTDCAQSELDVVADFFNGSCAPGNWSTQEVVQEKLREKYGEKLCSRCYDPSTCDVTDSYGGYEGTMKCLSEGSGQVAFTKIHALTSYLAKEPAFAQQAEFLCFEGGRKPLDDPEPCVWGERPTYAYLASSTIPASERERFVSVLLDTQTRYAVPQVPTPDWYYKSFLSSPKTTALQAVGADRNTYETYLGTFVHAIHKPRPACVGVKESFCVISDQELERCDDLRLASEARGMWPAIGCVKADSKAACMQTLKDGNGQLLVLDGGDIYKGGRYQGLQPVAGELYGTSDATYYAVAVIPSASDAGALSDLRGLRSCHTGIGRTAGWVMPVGALLSAGQLGEGCDRAEAVSEFFTGGSCVPGANDTKYNPDRSGSELLCRRCIGDEEGMHKCARDSKERYSGYAGALRCLFEGAGDVAFVKHTTVPDYSDGRSTADWAQNLVSSDFKLLCNSGGTAPVGDSLNCNLGKVPSHYVMTRGGTSEANRLQLAKLMGEFTKYFTNESTLFRLFHASRGQQQDLLFKDSATSLKVVPTDATYEQVLGEKYLAAAMASDPKDCAQ